MIDSSNKQDCERQVTLSIDGREVTVPADSTVWEAAQELGIAVPVLCHNPRLDPVGVCRMCVVDTGERVLAASCVRQCQDGMNVETDSEKVLQHRKMLTSLLLVDHPTPCERERTTGDCELEQLGREYGLLDEDGNATSSDSLSSLFAGTQSDLAKDPTVLAEESTDSHRRKIDLSSPVIAVDHQACILCDRCVRGCDDIQSNEVIGRSGKGYSAQIGFDLDNPMGESTCVSCGECVSQCPTGALTNRKITLPIVPAKDLDSTDSICPYCGVGCAVTFHATDNQIVFAEGRDSPVNDSRLCVKGRYGFDYATHPQRLTKPLIRREGFYPKQALSPEVQASIGKNRKPGGIVNYDDVMPAFREATWEEALELVGQRLSEIKENSGPEALAGFGSAKCSNEEAYLFQKLIRAGFQTNNVDHCTRLCHASSVAALMETIGSGAVTNVFADVERSDVALVAGSNTTSNHPVAATFIKDAAKKGMKLIVVDVRAHALTDSATHFAQLKSGSDVAFYNAVMHVLIKEDLVDQQFIRARTEGYDKLRELLLADYSPQQVESICGIDAHEIETIARTIGNAKNMLVFWGMGISQHTTGTDNARCLISLCLMTGNVGRPGTGLHPLRGQNNVQGASDAGLIPMVYPDYQSVASDDIRAKFEKAWGVELNSKPGLTVVEIMKAAMAKEIQGMYIMGENPFISDPNSNKVRQALSSLDFLVVQDIFLTETAEFADVILPASSYFEKQGTYTNTDRRVQLGRPVLESPGEAREVWKILCDIGKRLGVAMDYSTSSEVFDEFTSLTNNYQGLTHENLGATGKLWPCPDPENSDGVQILFGEQFPTASGKGKFVPCRYQGADEPTDQEFPFVLTTGRVLEHWHTGTMTRRSYALSTLEPDAFAAINPIDLKKLGVDSGQRIRVASRRGVIELAVRADDSIDTGTVFIPFHFREAAANILTTDALDPYGKIPEFKYCAVSVQPAE